MDREFAEFLEGFPALDFADPAALRAEFAGERPVSAQEWPDGVTHEIHNVSDVDGRGIPVHRYMPESAGQAAPTVLWIHGGGYCVGDVEQDESYCAWLARDAGVVVASVEYRLAPEDPYPAGLDDCYAVLLDIAASAGEEYPTGPLVVAGGSAGGGLAAALALRARDEGGPALHGQVLLYPYLDATMSGPSLSTLSEAPVFNATDARHCWKHYLGDALSDPPAYGSPSVAEDLTALPQAYVLVAGADCLRDEAVEYALRLQSAGVPTEMHMVPDVPHGFDRLVPAAGASRRLGKEVAAVVRRMAGLD